MAYRFREAREKAGLSTLEVSKRIGVSQPAVSQWDTGNKIPSVEMLRSEEHTSELQSQ